MTRSQYQAFMAKLELKDQVLGHLSHLRSICGWNQSLQSKTSCRSSNGNLECHCDPSQGTKNLEVDQAQGILP